MHATQQPLRLAARVGVRRAPLPLKQSVELPPDAEEKLCRLWRHAETDPTVVDADLRILQDIEIHSVSVRR